MKLRELAVLNSSSVKSNSLFLLFLGAKKISACCGPLLRMMSSKVAERLSALRRTLIETIVKSYADTRSVFQWLPTPISRLLNAGISVSNVLRSLSPGSWRTRIFLSFRADERLSI